MEILNGIAVKRSLRMRSNDVLEVVQGGDPS